MNGKNVGAWIVQGILAVLFLLAGSMKLAGTEQMVEEFRHWGYGDGFRLLIGVIEVSGGVVLLIPKVTALSALGLMVIMLGAAYTHLAHAEGLGATMPAIVLFVLLGLVAYVRRGSLNTLLAAIRK